jgi:hypothetical protein
MTHKSKSSLNSQRTLHTIFGIVAFAVTAFTDEYNIQYCKARTGYIADASYNNYIEVDKCPISCKYSVIVPNNRYCECEESLANTWCKKRLRVNEGSYQIWQGVCEFLDGSGYRCSPGGGSSEPVSSVPCSYSETVGGQPCYGEMSTLCE